MNSNITFIIFTTIHIKSLNTVTKYVIKLKIKIFNYYNIKILNLFNIYLFNIYSIYTSIHLNSLRNLINLIYIFIICINIIQSYSYIVREGGRRRIYLMDFKTN